MTATTKVIMDWIRGLGWDDRQERGWPVLAGPYVPPSPDQLVVITPGGGPGFTTEEAATDGSNFQALVRGAPGDPLGTEAVAQALDLLILRAQLPATVDGVTVVHVGRVSGGPDPLPYAPGDQRTVFTCNYTIVTGV